MGGGSQKRAINEQTKQIKANALAEEKRARELAVASQQQQESMIKRQKAVEAAQALEEGQVKQTVETDVSPEVGEEEIDPVSGRRIAPRERFRAAEKQSGLRF